jgi:hypothetical protein
VIQFLFYPPADSMEVSDQSYLLHSLAVVARVLGCVIPISRIVIMDFTSQCYLCMCPLDDAIVHDLSPEQDDYSLPVCSVGIEICIEHDGLSPKA